MLEELRIQGARLDHAAVRREISPEHRQGAFLVDGLVERADHIVIEYLRTGDVFSECSAGHRHRVQMQVLLHAHHQRGQSPGIVEILHEVRRAARLDVGDDRHLAAGPLEVVQPDGDPGTPSLGDQMNDGIGGAADGHRDVDGVLEGLARLDPCRRQILPDHLHDAPAGIRAHADVVGIRGRNGGRPRQGHAERLGQAGHGARRAHGHAGAVAARQPSFDARPVLGADLANLALHPQPVGIRTRAEHLAVPIAAQHGAGRNVDGRIAGAGGAEQQGRGGLVATAHEHRAVHRVGAQQLFGIHRQHVPIEHGGRLDEYLRQRQGGQFDGKSAGLQDAALHIVHARLEMRMAGLDVRPGVHNGDDGPSQIILRGIPHLHDALAVAGGAQIVRFEPARTA